MRKIVIFSLLIAMFVGCGKAARLERLGELKSQEVPTPTTKKEETANNTYLYVSVASLTAVVAGMVCYFVNKYNNKINKINWQTELNKRRQDPLTRELITKQSHLQYSADYNPTGRRELYRNYYKKAQKCPEGEICIAPQHSHKPVNDKPDGKTRIDFKKAYLPTEKTPVHRPGYTGKKRDNLTEIDPRFKLVKTQFGKIDARMKRT